MAKILVIEDHDSHRSLLARVLSDAGHVVIEAGNGKEGLAAAKLKTPDLVITDLVMPEKEGIETILELRREFPEIGIVAMSGAGRASTYLRLASQLGAQSTLAKPFPPEALLGAVDKSLRLSKPLRQSSDAPVEGDSKPKVAHRPFRFVVLDDDADNRFFHHRTLGRAFPGCEVIECSSTDEALRQCDGPRIDAVLTDNQLGGPDGSTFVRALRQKLVRCPILMVTASSDPRVAERAYAAGATRVFAPGAGDFSEYLRSVLRDFPCA